MMPHFVQKWNVLSLKVLKAAISNEVKIGHGIDVCKIQSSTEQYIILRANCSLGVHKSWNQHIK